MGSFGHFVELFVKITELRQVTHQISPAEMGPLGDPGGAMGEVFYMKSVYHVYLSVIRGAWLKRTDMNYSHLRFFGA